jgi:hypothetical protein
VFRWKIEEPPTLSDVTGTEVQLLSIPDKSLEESSTDITTVQLLSEN